MKVLRSHHFIISVPTGDISVKTLKAFYIHLSLIMILKVSYYYLLNSCIYQFDTNNVWFCTSIASAAPRQHRSDSSPTQCQPLNSCSCITVTINFNNSQSTRVMTPVTSIARVGGRIGCGEGFPHMGWRLGLVRLVDPTTIYMNFRIKTWVAAPLS